MGKLHQPKEATFIPSIASLGEVALWKNVNPKLQTAKGMSIKAQSLLS